MKVARAEPIAWIVTCPSCGEDVEEPYHSSLMWTTVPPSGESVCLCGYVFKLPRKMLPN
jgi:hypothetical protein